MGYACFGFIFRISFYTEDLVFTVLAQMIFPLKFFNGQCGNKCDDGGLS